MNSVEILLVEDNEADVFLTKKAFEKAKILNNMSVATDGEQAIQMLLKQKEYKDFVTPDIILLDINLPKKDGQEVLAEIKSYEGLRRIPVIILTSSSAEADIIKTYDLHVNSYIVKPLNLEKFYNVVSAIENFWFSVVTLPKI